jgi:hypothetical protein
MWHPLSSNVGTNLANKRRSLVGIVRSRTQATEFLVTYNMNERNGTRDLQAGSIGPQRTALPRATVHRADLRTRAGVCPDSDACDLIATCTHSVCLRGVYALLC